MILILILEFFVVKSIVFQIISLALFLGSLVTGLVTYLVCPGITFKEKEEYENNKNLKNFYCQQCNFTYPKNKMSYQHCFPCGVCIPDSDHHCGVFGKCIGHGNKLAFYLFPTFSIIMLIICFVSVLYHFMHEVTKKNENKEGNLL